MEIKFNSIDELETFIIEKLGYVKADSDNTNKELNYKPIIVKECPYGFTHCPYNRDISPYNPILTQTYVDTSKNTDNGSVTINMKDISQNAEK